MLAFTTLDVVTVIGALSAALVSIIGAIFSGLNRRALKTPSGESAGTVLEQTHALTAANALRTKQIVRGEIKPPNGMNAAPPPEPLPGESPPPA